MMLPGGPLPPAPPPTPAPVNAKVLVFVAPNPAGPAGTSPGFTPWQKTRPPAPAAAGAAATTAASTRGRGHGIAGDSLKGDPHVGIPGSKGLQIVGVLLVHGQAQLRGLAETGA